MLRKNLLFKFGLTLTMILIAFSGIGAAAIPQQSSSTLPENLPANCTQYYVVKHGDYLVKIARMFNTTWQYLAQINNLQNPRLLYAGNILCVRTSSAVIPNTGGTPSASTPTITVTNVVRNQKVTIHGVNFPPNEPFNVLLGTLSNQAINGVYITRLTTPQSGHFTATFDIPSSLQGQSQIAIRLQSPTSNFYSYNWFYNTSTTGQSTNVIPDTGGQPANTRQENVSAGNSEDIFQGNAGIFMPTSNYTGTVTVERYDPSKSNTVKNIQFTQQLLKVTVSDQQGNPITQVTGLNYVYFNLDEQSRSDYNNGNLAIYHYNPQLQSWVQCQYPVLITDKNRPYGRMACIIQNFGLYGVAAIK